MRIERYDAVVVMGSGFRGPDTPEIDKWGRRRLSRAVELLQEGKADFIIITGGTVHPEFGVRFADVAWKIVLQQGVDPLKILIPSNFGDYPKTTGGDVDQAIDIASARHLNYLVFVTEKPHWLFRVRILTNLDRTGFMCSGWDYALSAPVWYWVKEFIYWVAILFSFGREDSGFHRIAAKLWKRSGHLFRLYVINKGGE